MKFNLFSITKQSVRDLTKNPLLFLPFLLFSIAFYFLSEFSREANEWLVRESLNKTPYLIAWLSIYTLIFLYLLALASSTLFQMVKKEKIEYKRSFTTFWVFLIITILSAIISISATSISFYLGKSINLNLGIAKAVFISILFFFYIFILNFTIYAPIYSSIEKSSIKQSFKKSFSLVKQNYLETLTLIICIMVISFLINNYINFRIFQGATLGTLIESLLFYPLIGIILTKIVLKK